MADFQVGDRAPEFTATTQDGRQIRLADYLGARGLVLFFYPRNGTPVCTAEACAFRDAYDRFLAAGMDVIGVSADSAASHTKFAARHHLKFPLVSDADGALRTLFRVPNTLGLIPQRVTFVIDKAGIIRRIYSAQFASEEHVRQALEAIGAA